MPVVVREFKGSKVSEAQPSVWDVQLRVAFKHLSAHAAEALCSGCFLLIVESKSPELAVAPDHKEDEPGFIAQDEHLLFERVPETFVQPLSDTRSFRGFEIVACNIHDNKLLLRVWGRAPRVSRNAAATPDVRVHSQP